MVQWLRPHLPMQGMKVQSLVGELRSHMPHGQKTKTQNSSNIVKNSIMIFKMDIKRKNLKSTFLENATSCAKGLGQEQTQILEDKEKTGIGMQSVKETAVRAGVWVLNMCQTGWSHEEFGAFPKNNGRALKVFMQEHVKVG